MAAFCFFLAYGAFGQQHRVQGSSDAAAAQRLHEAIVVEQHGDPQRALALTRQLLATRPAYEPALKFEAVLLQDSGQDAEAQRCFEQALQLAPRDPELLFAVGVGRLRERRFAAADDVLEQGAKLAPRDAQMFYYLAQAQHLNGHDDQALASSKRSVELAPHDAAMLLKYGELLSGSGNNAEAQTWLLKARALDPTLEHLDFDLGIVSFRNEDLDAASQYAAAALAKEPNDARVLRLTAEVDVKLGRWDDAKTVFLQLLTLDPHDASARLELGHSELALKQYQDAVNTLQQVVESDPTTILAHFYLARAYTGLGMTAAAAHETELHNQLVARAGSVIPVDERQVEKATLLEARQLLTEGREQEAVALFRSRAKGPTATPGEPLMLVGVSYLYMGRSADAERCLQQALAVDSTVRDAHTYLGLLELQRQDLAGAEEQFNAELRLDPNSQLAVGELGEVRYRQGRWAEAAEQITRSRTVTPALLYMLSDADFHLGKTKDADTAAELAVDYGRADSANVTRVLDLLTRNGQDALAAKLGRTP